MAVPLRGAQGARERKKFRARALSARRKRTQEAVETCLRLRVEKLLASATLVRPIGYVKYKSTTGCVSRVDTAGSGCNSSHASKTRQNAVEVVQSVHWARSSRPVTGARMRAFLTVRREESRRKRGDMCGKVDFWESGRDPGGRPAGEPQPHPDCVWMECSLGPVQAAG